MTARPPASDLHAAFMAAPGGGVVDDLGPVPMADLQEMAEVGANRLRTVDIRRNEPVLVPILGRAEDVAGIMAVIGAGGTAVPFSVKSHSDVQAHLTAATGARFRFRDPGNTRTLPRIDTISADVPPLRPLLDGAAMITFTSGSTGLPKGVVLDRARISSKYAAICDAIALDGQPVAAVPLQLQFSFGQWATFLPLCLGGTVHMTSRFSRDSIEALLAKGQLTHLAAVPTMLRMLMDGPVRDGPLTILTGGEAVSQSLRQKLFDRFPAATLHSIYGLTETGTCDLFRTDRADSAAPDGLGFPTKGIEVRSDPDTSELLIRSPFCMKGYLDSPEATAATLKGGWLHTGDMAEVAADGSVVLKGRIKELINRGGNKVSPPEVESVFAGHPGVKAVLATGVPDARIGEAIHLLVVSHEDPPPKAEDLIDWAKGRTDRFKLPDVIHFGDALPLGNTGKADRAALRRDIIGNSG